MEEGGATLYECEHCGEGKKYRLRGDETPVGTFRWCVKCKGEVCRLCREQVEKLETHHCSYLYDITIRVCPDCHQRIHHEDNYYDGFVPAITRSHAEEIGIEHTFQN